MGLYRKGETEIPNEQLLDKKGGKLSGKFIKVDSDKKGIEGYDKDGNKLDGVYKKEETGVEPIVGYNQNGNKLEGIFPNVKKSY